MIKALMIKGSAGELRFLDNDVSLMSTAMEAIQIPVYMITGSKYVVLQQVATHISNLSSVDVLIIYYTGHGVMRQGSICLKLGDGSRIQDFLSMDELILTTKEARNNNVILILDCCNAGAVVDGWKKYTSDKHALFLSSGKLQSVKEIGELESSLFTYSINKAIMESPDDLFLDDRITLGKLYHVVSAYIHNYNNEYGTKMPMPELFRAESNEIVLGCRKKKNEQDELEMVIRAYIASFIDCIKNCDKICYNNTVWCQIIFKTDVNIGKIVFPHIKSFSDAIAQKFLIKLDVFFERWFKTEQSYLGLLGDMGVGKSTACIYLFYYLCNKYGKEYNYIPVFFPLDTLHEHLPQNTDLYNAICYFMNENFTVEQVKELCRQRRLVFILDGFDEISGDSKIATILHNYGKLKNFFRLRCKTVLTCRTHYFSEEDQLEEVLTGKNEGTDFAALLLADEYVFNMVEIQEFTEDEIQELIHVMMPERDPEQVWKTIRGLYDLGDLAKRAILLKMILQTLPELEKKKTLLNSATLYMLYTKKLLRREIERRNIGIELSEKENFISYIAFLMFKNDTLIIDTKKFNEEIKNYFQESIYDQDQLNSYNYDCKVAAFFSRDKQDKYRFIHKSFYEYYFAKYCINRMSEGDTEAWSYKWFPREIACFISGLLSDCKYRLLISEIINVALTTTDHTLIWNTLHELSLLSTDILNDILTDELCSEFIERGERETDCVIIRQYCRIIAKFIDRKCAEQLIDKIIAITRNDIIQNEKNDLTYYNYYGGKKAACQAFIKHLSVKVPKYDAKLHLYLLEHIAPVSYIERIEKITANWENRDEYATEITHTISRIKDRENIINNA